MGLAKAFKLTTLGIIKGIGGFRLVGSSSWRRGRLLILCYHGVSLELENQWRPPLFMTEGELQDRLEVLHRGPFRVLSLADGIHDLYSGSLPAHAVAITFDDGNYDFYAKAYPLLKEIGFPATVYLTTYYADRRVPVFHLICSYLLWKHRGAVVSGEELMGAGPLFNTASPGERDLAVSALVAHADREGLTVTEKDDLAKTLAGILGEDPAALWEKRVLQLMNADEVREVAAGGIDVQLHTHRHRSPLEKSLYIGELNENSRSIIDKTGREPVHFCYPSGVCRPEFLPWLEEAGVQSATTCVPGLASPSDHPLLLPRLIDHSSLSMLEFEAWLSGVSVFLPRRRESSSSGPNAAE